MLLVVKPTHAVEYLTGSQEVEGSTPAGPTIHIRSNETAEMPFILLFGKRLIVSFIAFPMALMMTKKRSFSFFAPLLS